MDGVKELVIYDCPIPIQLPRHLQKVAHRVAFDDLMLYEKLGYDAAYDVDVFGSWDDWRAPVACEQVNPHWCAFRIRLAPGEYTYKYKYRRIEDAWAVGDCAPRAGDASKLVVVAGTQKEDADRWAWILDA
jgi:hypothetical protein